MKVSSIGRLAVLLLAAPHLMASIPEGTPSVVVDLATPDGAALMQVEWRYRDVAIVPVEFPGPDATGQPTGPARATWDIRPRAGVADYDDRDWSVIPADSLSARRGGGRLSFNWYRARLRIPQRIGSFDPDGSSLVFVATLDDYAEVWVDGELTRAPAQTGGSVTAGWNAPNRVIVARRVRPGQEIQLAIFGMNGPISDAPTNYIYVREARLEFYPGLPSPAALPVQETNVVVERIDPAIDAIVPANAKLFKLAEGFDFIEGPVWVTEPGYLLFSDPNRNRIYAYDPAGASLSLFRDRSGYDGADIAEYHQPGSNGLALDARGRLTINEHGNRRVTRIESDGAVTVVADRYQGRRLNSPNDLVYRSNGDLYFTDPPFGLPKVFDDPRKALPFSGVYRVRNGRVELLASELAGPNGLAFSPDERYLYVDNWDPARKVVMRYPVRRDGRLGDGEVFFDMTSAPGEEALDGLKVDELGNLFVSGPGGVWIIAADGRHLGTIRGPRLPANFAFGGNDGRMLYLTARSALYRMPLLVRGAVGSR